MTNVNATVRSTLRHAMALCPLPLPPSALSPPQPWNCSSFAAVALQGCWVGADVDGTVMASQALQAPVPAPASTLHSIQRQRKSTTDLTMNYSRPVLLAAWALNVVVFGDDVSCNSRV